MIKSIILNILRTIRYVMYRFIKNFYFTNFKCISNVRLISFDLKESFFGYYNLSPENKSTKKLICAPDGQENHIYIIEDDNNYKYVGSSMAWNWQQGSMLQWSPNNKNIIYYNSYNQLEKKYNTSIVDIAKNHLVKTLSKPICCVSQDESYTLSLNFERLTLMRPDYGYFCNKEINLPDNENDGIWKINLKTNQEELIITLKQLIDLSPVETMVDEAHKVNHIDIAPDSKRFMFLHRWVGPKGRFMRLITANKDGKDLFILNGDKMISHSCWLDNNHIISFCYTDQFGEAYTVFVDKTNEFKVLSNNLPKCDGHPSVDFSGKWMITDTYPQFDRMSRLYLYNFHTDEVICLGRLYQPLKYSGSYRIDLHPKWNLNGDKIYFESGHNGLRNFYALDVSRITNQE
jgi:hypothetical protein